MPSLFLISRIFNLLVVIGHMRIRLSLSQGQSIAVTQENLVPYNPILFILEICEPGSDHTSYHREGKQLSLVIATHSTARRNKHQPQNTCK